MQRCVWYSSTLRVYTACTVIKDKSMLGFLGKLFGKKADVNGDGQINMADAQALKDQVNVSELKTQVMDKLDTNNDGTVNMQDVSGTINTAKSAADINGDGTVSAQDAAALKDKIV
jgi:hypothetical protein